MSFFRTGAPIAASQRFGGAETDIFSVGATGQIGVSWVLPRGHGISLCLSHPSTRFRPRGAWPPVNNSGPRRRSPREPESLPTLLSRPCSHSRIHCPA